MLLSETKRKDDLSFNLLDHQMKLVGGIQRCSYDLRKNLRQRVLKNYETLIGDSLISSRSLIR